VLLARDDPGAAACGFLTDLRDTRLPAGDERVRVTASAGVRCATAAGVELLAEAALALAEAKELGRDRLVVEHDGAATVHARQRRFWSQRVREALVDGSLCLMEQPIVRLRDGVPESSELLLRLRDRDGGLITPDRFLPAAERTGQIRTIDRWVLGEAIDLLAARQAVGIRGGLNVNLSGASLVDADTVDAIVARLAAAPVDPSELTFEVTETAAVRQMQTAERLARQLAELGCGFAVDDFGTGWASFSYLKHLPVSQLKIDGSFVRGLTESQRDRTTVRAMVDIAREYRIRSVAESVQDSETLELLAGLGVDLAQGFLLGPPVPAAVRA
jgi:EAL domain-containing protein (putative c-di-GMP-specific phosphodiesterase class I)